MSKGPVNSIKDLFEIVFTPLKAWAESQQAKAVIASDEQQAWAYCFASEVVPKFIIVWTGEEMYGEDSVSAINRMANNNFDIIVTRNRGLQVDRAQTLVWNASVTPLFEIVQQVRDLIRCIQDTALPEWPINYKGTEQFNIPGFIMDCYRIRFQILNFLPSESPALNAVTQST